MRKILFAVLIFFLARPVAAQLTQKGQETQVTCSGTTCVLVTPNSPVNPNLLVNSGVNTFIVGVAPPTNAVRLYITNDTANACANLTVTMASTGNSTLTSFNNNQSSWQTIQVQTGTTGFVASSPITLPASGTVAITSQPIIGSKLVVFVVLSAGCATTNVDMQLVFGTFTPTIGSVQGVSPTGSAASTENPVLIGATNASGNIALPQACNPTGVDSCSGFNLTGLAVGGANIGTGSTSSSMRTPGGSIDGWWPSAITAILGSTSGGQLGVLRQSNNPSGNCNAATANCLGLFVSDTGYHLTQFNPTVVNTNQTQPLWQVGSNFNAGMANAMVETCNFTIKTVNTAGTAPTLDIYLSDSSDQNDFNDRIHFTQATTGTLVQVAGIAGSSTNLAVGPATANTIPAGTIVSGPLGAYAELRFIIGGTASPSYNVTIGVACK